MLDGGTSANDSQEVAGTVTLTPDKAVFKAGDTVRITVSGKGLKNINAMSLPCRTTPAFWNMPAQRSRG